jgi:hypothetical protein
VVYGPGGADYWWAKQNISFGKNTDAMKEDAQVAKIEDEVQRDGDASQGQESVGNTGRHHGCLFRGVTFH